MVSQDDNDFVVIGLCDFNPYSILAKGISMVVSYPSAILNLRKTNQRIH